jgi:hypothetical protein
MKKTVIAEMYEGTLRSTLTVAKQKPSVTLQPFVTLPLDIDV